jgi:hypothetical protein
MTITDGFKLLYNVSIGITQTQGLGKRKMEVGQT